MTKEYYNNFLSYLSEKERSLLILQLQRANIQVKGFRLNKNIPNGVLSQWIEKNEDTFIRVLMGYRTPLYASKEEVIEGFSPDTAIDGFLYLMQKQQTDELLLGEISEKLAVAIEEIKIDKPPIVERKVDKRADDFRKKYLITRKELDAVKTEMKLVLEENQKLKIQVEEGINRLIVIQEELSYRTQAYDKQETMMRRQISELESSLSRLTRTVRLQERKILVLTDGREVVPQGVAAIPIQQFKKHSTTMRNFSEILYVPSSLTFSVKRQIEKADEIQGKIHEFSTWSELMKYIEN